MLLTHATPEFEAVIRPNRTPCRYSIDENHRQVVAPSEKNLESSPDGIYGALMAPKWTA